MTVQIKTGITFLCAFASLTVSNAAEDTWESYISSQAQLQSSEVVQNRQIIKDGRIQLGVSYGTSQRNDFTNTMAASLSIKKYFRDSFGWEFMNFSYSESSDSALLNDLKTKTDYKVDSKKSRYQLATALVFAPIYGKYSWFDKKIIYFDMYSKLGAGLRFADVPQFFVLGSLGMNNYFSGGRFSIGPEVTTRLYSEDRNAPTQVFETLFQIGGAWLF